MIAISGDDYPFSIFFSTVSLAERRTSRVYLAPEPRSLGMALTTIAPVNGVSQPMFESGTERMLSGRTFNGFFDRKKWSGTLKCRRASENAVFDHAPGECLGAAMKRSASNYT